MIDSSLLKKFIYLKFAKLNKLNLEVWEVYDGEKEERGGSMVDGDCSTFIWYLKPYKESSVCPELGGTGQGYSHFQVFCLHFTWGPDGKDNHQKEDKKYKEGMDNFATWKEQDNKKELKKQWKLIKWRKKKFIIVFRNWRISWDIVYLYVL